MYFAEIYVKSSYSGKNIPLIGDRGILILDGRESKHLWKNHIKQHCQKHKIEATSFVICRGESLLRYTKLYTENI